MTTPFRLNSAMQCISWLQRGAEAEQSQGPLLKRRGISELVEGAELLGTRTVFLVSVARSASKLRKLCTGLPSASR